MQKLLFLLLLLFVPLTTNATLSLSNIVEVHPTEEASALNSEVAELPEVHFLDEQKRRGVDILLAHALTAQNKHIVNFSDALNGYVKDIDD
ncbi:hypothetical protein [Psychromonas aquatilis]|uniref:Uncharacterized protein n=1 Tax=Psychromonas aquatilis TaxID=2005072 RepID=A0ABU9GSI7_9GAMM